MSRLTRKAKGRVDGSLQDRFEVYCGKCEVEKRKKFLARGKEWAFQIRLVGMGLLGGYFFFFF